MAYTDRVVGGDYNRVADVDGRILFGGVYCGSFQYAQSYDKTRGSVTNAPLWEGILARNGKRFGFRYTMTGIDEKFRTLTGFISRPGIAHGALDHRATWFNERGNLLETLTGDILFDDTWQYSHLLNRGATRRTRNSTSARASGLRGGWTLGAGVYWETFGWDQQLFRNYQIERTIGTKVDTVPFTGVGRIPNRDYVLNFATPQWSQFNASLLYVFGQDENFFEWAQANINYISLATNFRPTDHLRINGTLSYQDYWRRTDHSLAGRNAIPRVKVEYQFTRAIFLRAVGEYDLSEHDDLRDETRTFFPLIIGGKKALATRSAQFHADWLFSYRANPGAGDVPRLRQPGERGPEPARAVQLPAAGAGVGLLLREVQLSVSHVATGLGEPRLARSNETVPTPSRAFRAGRPRATIEIVKRSTGVVSVSVRRRAEPRSFAPS